MKTSVVPLIGDPLENLYQLGLREKEAFFLLEKRVIKLLSTNFLLQMGQEIITRAKTILKKKNQDQYFEKCIKAYSQGMGIDPNRYYSFLNLFELAAHYGQIFPELKSMLPGCTSVFSTQGDEVGHVRLLDFPLIGIFEARPRFYYWQGKDSPTLLTYSCEGMAPLMFQGIHESGMSFALHHKPGATYHEEGQSIFQIAFDGLMAASSAIDFKKEMKKKTSITKWCFLLLDKSGAAQALDIDGPALNSEFYNLKDTSPLIFTNIPLQKDSSGHESYLKFSENRQSWTKTKLSSRKSSHILDLLTDVTDQKNKKWVHSAATLSTVGAYYVNLSEGYIDVKEGDGALVASDAIIRLSLSKHQDIKVLKPAEQPNDFETAWKRASLAQAAFDQGDIETAYHELQMALAIIPHPVWKEIMNFYLCLWDFKFVTNTKELGLIYKKTKSLTPPEALKDQWLLLIMRLEKKLGLSSTVSAKDLSTHLHPLYWEEKAANKAVFATWMKLIYPRMEILDVFSPHHK